MTKTIKQFIVCFTLCFCYFSSLGQLSKIDSLFFLLKKDKEDTTKVIHLNDLSRELMYDKPDTSISICIQAISIAEKLSTSANEKIATKGKKEIATAYTIIGIINDGQGDYPKALDYFLKALKINEELNDKSGIAKRLTNIGIVYEELSDYPKSLDNYFRGLKIAEEIGDKNRIATILGNMGTVYRYQVDYTKSLDYYFRALKIDEELGKKDRIASWLGNIGIVYKEQADNEKSKTKQHSLYKKSLEYYFKALKLKEELGIKNGIANTLGNIGLVYFLQGDYSIALDYYLRALKLQEELDNKDGIGRNLGNMGLLYTTTGKYQEAFNCLYKALALSDSSGTKNVSKDTYKGLSTLYEKSTIPLHDSIRGKLLNMEQMRLRSLYYHKRFVNIKDELFSEESKKQLVRKEMNFEFDKKEATAKVEQEKKDTVTKIIIFSISAGFGLVLLLAIFIFRGYRQKQRTNRIISEQKLLVEEKQRDILDSIRYAKRIQQSLLPTEKYIERNFSRLKKK